MPKLKTHRGAAKRFKRTKSGKFLRGKAFKQHILSSKSTKRKRGLRGTTTVADVDRRKIAATLAYAGLAGHAFFVPVSIAAMAVRVLLKIDGRGTHACFFTFGR